MDVNFDKKQVNKESFKDAAMRRRARGQVKQTLEERCVEPERCEGEEELVTLRPCCSWLILLTVCSLCRTTCPQILQCGEIYWREEAQFRAITMLPVMD